jgi:hypothetical protein
MPAHSKPIGNATWDSMRSSEQNRAIGAELIS